MLTNEAGRIFQGCNASPPLNTIGLKGLTKMGETQQFRNFRIWVAVGTAVLYVFLAMTGNA
jgi:hypothetical protein